MRVAFWFLQDFEIHEEPDTPGGAMKVPRKQLAASLLIVAAGLLTPVVAPVVGPQVGYYGTHNGIPTYSQHHVCTWCKR